MIGRTGNNAQCMPYKKVKFKFWKYAFKSLDITCNELWNDIDIFGMLFMEFNNFFFYN